MEKPLTLKEAIKNIFPLVMGLMIRLLHIQVQLQLAKRIKINHGLNGLWYKLEVNMHSKMLNMTLIFPDVTIAG
jgi:hypothetical protein